MHEDELTEQRLDGEHRRRANELREVNWREQDRDLVAQVHALVFKPCDEELSDTAARPGSAQP